MGNSKIADHLALINMINQEHERAEESFEDIDDRVYEIKKRIEKAKNANINENKLCEINKDNKHQIKEFIKQFIHFKIDNFFVDLKTSGDDFKVIVYEETSVQFPYFTSRSKVKIDLTNDTRFRRFDMPGQQNNNFYNCYLSEDRVCALLLFIVKQKKLNNFI